MQAGVKIQFQFAELVNVMFREQPAGLSGGHSFPNFLANLSIGKALKEIYFPVKQITAQISQGNIFRIIAFKLFPLLHASFPTRLPGYIVHTRLRNIPLSGWKRAVMPPQLIAHITFRPDKGFHQIGRAHV